MQDINGVPTDIAVSIFADRVFIVVTQLGTFGTLVQQAADGGEDHILLCRQS
jgi:hypothetical protein